MRMTEKKQGGCDCTSPIGLLAQIDVVYHMPKFG